MHSQGVNPTFDDVARSCTRWAIGDRVGHPICTALCTPPQWPWSSSSLSPTVTCYLYSGVVAPWAVCAPAASPAFWTRHFTARVLHKKTTEFTTNFFLRDSAFLGLQGAQEKKKRAQPVAAVCDRKFPQKRGRPPQPASSVHRQKTNHAWFGFGFGFPATFSPHRKCKSKPKGDNARH